MADRPDDQILALSVDEGLALVDSIWESIRQNPGEVPVDEEVKVTMQRRLASHRHDPGAADDLDAVLTRLRARD